MPQTNYTSKEQPDGRNQFSGTFKKLKILMDLWTYGLMDLWTEVIGYVVNS